MTDETNSISRRNVLAGLGTAGAGAAIVGAGTSALFSDGETLPNNQLVAGELSLVVDWQEEYDMGEGMRLIDVFPSEEGNYSEQADLDIDQFCQAYAGIDDPLNHKRRSIIDYHDRDDITKGTDTNEPLVYLDDIKPGDCWETTFSYHLCDNDGWVWFRTSDMRFEDRQENNKPNNHLADRAWARVWYDMYEGENGEIPGDNVYQEGKEPIIAQGSLRDVLEELEGGVLLDGDPHMGLPTDENGNPASDNGDCVKVGKFDDTPGEGEGDITGELTDVQNMPNDFEFRITGLHWKDEDENGEVVGIDWESNYGICNVSVKGGTDSEPNEPNTYNCAFEGTAFAPFGAGPDGNKRHEISHFTIWYCEGVAEPPEEPGTDPVCTSASTTHYIGFEWCLPAFDDDGDVIDNNAIQGDGLSFDFEFYTEQCRHNDDPTNPWNGGNDA